MLPKKRQPTHPGEVLLEEFLIPMGLKQTQFLEYLVKNFGNRWTYAKLNEIVNGKRGITSDTAIDLAIALGTTPVFWLNLQTQYNLWKALEARGRQKLIVSPLKIAV